MTISLARLKKWLPVLVGIVAGLCFGIWSFFQNVNTNYRPFYAEPVIWVGNLLRALFGPREIDLPFMVLLWFIYCVCLGALFGFLFQLFFDMFRRLKRPDTIHQIKARPMSL
jgi:hypothetical protein